MFIAFCHSRTKESYHGVRLASRDSATFKRSAKSAGAGLRPSDAIMRCVCVNDEHSAAHAEHDAVCRETVCISAPVRALSR